jgi:uncharacterized membrane protein
MPSFEEIIDLGWEPEVLEAKNNSIKRDATIGVAVGAGGLILGSFFILLFGLFFGVFFGLIVGAYAIYSGRDALVNINVYGVGRAYKGIARAAQLLGGLSIIWPLTLTILLFAQG